MYEGNQWSTPSILDLRKKIRYAFENQKEVEQKGKQALEDIKKLTWEKSAKKLLRTIDEKKENRNNSSTT